MQKIWGYVRIHQMSTKLLIMRMEISMNPISGSSSYKFILRGMIDAVDLYFALSA